MERLTPTKIFLDGGDPEETAAATKLLEEAGYTGLDGQTTNPSLVAKNPAIAARMERGEKLTEEELLGEYKKIIQGIDASIGGDISVEVYADKDTMADQMIEQAREFNSWSPSAVIKLPTTEQGLVAAEQLKKDMRLNMTLCFSQQQAAAVYAATVGSAHPVYVSPFVGRLDDAGLDGVQHIRNVLQMYKEGDGHVHVLTASFRRQESILEVIRLGTHAVTINYKLFEPWAKEGFPLEVDYVSDGADIPYQELDLSLPWDVFDISHELTDSGLQRFADDWNSLLKQ